MNQIKCPHCGKEFTIDESSYAEILNQIRTKEFNEEIHEKLDQIKKQHQGEIKLLEEKSNNLLDKKIAEKEKSIIELNSKITNFANEKELLKKDTEKNMLDQIAEKEKIISELNAKMQMIENDKKLELIEANTIKEKEITDLKTQLQLQEKETKLEKNSIKENYENEIKQKDETIAFYKDFKAKQSTKMIGESLEQHCETEFMRLRSTAFQNAEFGKDNDAKTGSKGDYIYREFDENGTEIISIMFEMKMMRRLLKRKMNIFLKS